MVGGSGEREGIKEEMGGNEQAHSPRVKISPIGNLPLRYLTELFD